MKTVKTSVIVRLPVEKIWRLMRDDLPNVLSLDNISEIVEMERTVADCGSVLTVRNWSATLPKFAQLVSNSTSIKWTDSSVWHNDRLKCDWTIAITSPLLEENSSCVGSATYESALAGKGTKVGLQTTLSLGIAKESNELLVGELIIANFSKVLRTISDS
ncbi:MAG: hypothetical protein JST89_13455 [Cyanobacteria bacterium SZAS-4]|nr:hypothetical protein [Cyanobacteria bacterium SZAS-4]